MLLKKLSYNTKEKSVHCFIFFFFFFKMQIQCKKSLSWPVVAWSLGLLQQATLLGAENIEVNGTDKFPAFSEVLPQ